MRLGAGTTNAGVFVRRMYASQSPRKAAMPNSAGPRPRMRESTAAPAVGDGSGRVAAAGVTVRSCAKEMPQPVGEPHELRRGLDVLAARTRERDVDDLADL